MHTFSKSILRAVPLLVLGTVVHADDDFCNNAVPPAEHFQCVHTTVGPGAVTVVSFDQIGSGPLTAASFSAGSGAFASAASASADASPGLLRGFASAAMLGGSVPDASAVAKADSLGGHCRRRGRHRERNARDAQLHHQYRRQLRGRR